MPNAKYYQKYYSDIKDDNDKYEQYKKYMTEYQKKPFYCELCDKTITISKKYKHMKSKKHLINSGEFTKPDKIKCNICNFSIYEKNLETHVLSNYHIKLSQKV